MDNNLYADLHNKHSNSSFTLGVTPFSDMTNEEFKKYISLTEVDLGSDICKSQVKPLGTIPSAIDWRDKNAVTPVKDQSVYGTCYSFSTTGAIEGAYSIKNGELISFSEQQIVDCSYTYGNHGTNGGMMQNAFTYVHDHGLTTENAYPYTGASSRSSCKEFKPVTYLSGCINVTPNSEEMLTYAVAQGPVSIAIEADSKSFQLYKSGIYDDAFGCGTTLDHGVLTVGYGTENGKDYWTVKNSWSESWGDKGYIRLLRNSASTNAPGMCGIAMDASYPVI
jgi:C1A family cysteine protease